MNRRMAMACVVNAVMVAHFPQATAAAEEVQQPGEWQGKMQGLADVMGELLPELAAQRGNIEIIERNAKKLAALSHGLIRATKDDLFVPPPDADPSIALLAGRFDLDARRAYQTIQRGDVEYGKQLLRTTMSSCIACHSRHEQSTDFLTLPLNPRVESLNRSERAELLAATLQFDEALAEFQGVLSDTAASKAHPLEWERALHHALAIAVRVKNSPELAEDIVERVASQPTATEFMKENAARWKGSIADWKAEPKRNEWTEKRLYAELKRLLKDARQLQRYPADRAADILYLRTSATAHGLLRIAPEGPHATEAMYVAGVAYEVLNDPPLWSIHELFYEACIRRSPHTRMAEQCYRRYEDAIYSGYSGSGGTFVPDDVKAELVQLKQLARASTRRTRVK